MLAQELLELADITLGFVAVRFRTDTLREVIRGKSEKMLIEGLKD
jgi:hypothetical protein